jgi:hypothetical protein
MTLDVLNTEGSKVSQVQVNEEVFDGSVKDSLFHEVVKMQLACRRSGTASTKTRSEVSKEPEGRGPVPGVRLSGDTVGQSSARSRGIILTGSRRRS